VENATPDRAVHRQILECEPSRFLGITPPSERTTEPAA